MNNFTPICREFSNLAKEGNVHLNGDQFHQVDPKLNIRFAKKEVDLANRAVAGTAREIFNDYSIVWNPNNFRPNKELGFFSTYSDWIKPWLEAKTDRQLITDAMQLKNGGQFLPALKTLQKISAEATAIQKYSAAVSRAGLLEKLADQRGGPQSKEYYMQAMQELQFAFTQAESDDEKAIYANNFRRIVETLRDKDLITPKDALRFDAMQDPQLKEMIGDSFAQGFGEDSAPDLDKAREYYEYAYLDLFNIGGENELEQLGNYSHATLSALGRLKDKKAFVQEILDARIDARTFSELAYQEFDAADKIFKNQSLGHGPANFAVRPNGHRIDPKKLFNPALAAFQQAILAENRLKNIYNAKLGIQGSTQLHKLYEGVLAIHHNTGNIEGEMEYRHLLKGERDYAKKIAESHTGGRLLKPSMDQRITAYAEAYGVSRTEAKRYFENKEKVDLKDVLPPIVETLPAATAPIPPPRTVLHPTQTNQPPQYTAAAPAYNPNYKLEALPPQGAVYQQGIQTSAIPPYNTNYWPEVMPIMIPTELPPYAYPESPYTPKPQPSAPPQNPVEPEFFYTQY